VILIKKVPAKQLEMDLPVLKYTPPQAVEKARAFIISKVGQDFFDKYYVLAVDETEKENKDRTGQTSVIYFYTGLNKIGGGNKKVNISLDFDRNLSYTTGDVFDCDHLFSCDFKVNKEMAIEIAKKAGFNTTSPDFSVTAFSSGDYLTGMEWEWEANEVVYTTNPYPCLIKKLEINISTGKVSGPFENFCPGD
jgi:hypothetical protein